MKEYNSYLYDHKEDPLATYVLQNRTIMRLNHFTVNIIKKIIERNDKPKAWYTIPAYDTINNFAYTMDIRDAIAMFKQGEIND